MYDSKACSEKQKVNSEYPLSPETCLFSLPVDGQNKPLINIKYDIGLPLEIV